MSYAGSTSLFIFGLLFGRFVIVVVAEWVV